MNICKEINVYYDVENYLKNICQNVHFCPINEKTFSARVQDSYRTWWSDNKPKDKVIIEATCIRNHPQSAKLWSEYHVAIEHNNELPHLTEKRCELSGITAHQIYNLMKRIYEERCAAYRKQTIIRIKL